jgi:aspartyl-tRNA(Asn)/glutamyl-tRNA(Gln) amidotransferase subunit B
MVTDKTIGASAGKTVLIELFKNGGDPAQIVKEKNLAQLSDVGAIQELVTKILNDNPKEVEQYLAGKDTLFQWLMGQVARASKGKADPNVAKELMMKGLEERRK